MKYTEEYINWLVLHKDNFSSLPEITKAFNDTFGLKKTTEAIRNFYRKRKDITPSIKRNIPIQQEEIDWINANANKYNTVELLERLNAIYGNNRTKYTLRELIERGKIKKPLSTVQSKIVIGKSIMMECGIKAWIIAARKCEDIDLNWEDGSRSKHVRYSDYKNGKVSHPLIRYHRGNFHGYMLDGIAMRCDEDVYYKVITPEGKKEILKVRDILDSLTMK